MFSHLSKIIASAFLSISMLFGGHAPQALDPIGAIQPAADFRSSLVSQITAAATTMTLVSTSTPSGEVLVQGKTYGFKLGGTEYVIGTLSSGKQITGMTRGVSLINGTTTGGIASAWGRGTSVEITDAPILLEISNKISGTQNFDNLITYSPTVSTSTLAGAQIPSAAWVLAQTTAVTNVSNADGSLTISPTIGNVVSSINLAHNNVWTASSTNTSTVNSLAERTGTLGVSSSTPFTKLSVGSGAISVAEYQPATSTSMTLDWTNGNQQLVRIGTSAVTVAFSNYIPGQKMNLILCNPASGTAGAVTFTNVRWAGGTAPTTTTTANKCDILTFLATNGTSTPVVLGGYNQNY